MHSRTARHMKRQIELTNFPHCSQFQQSQRWSIQSIHWQSDWSQHSDLCQWTANEDSLTRNQTIENFSSNRFVPSQQFHIQSEWRQGKPIGLLLPMHPKRLLNILKTFSGSQFEQLFWHLRNSNVSRAIWNQNTATGARRQCSSSKYWNSRWRCNQKTCSIWSEGFRYR